MPYELVRRLVTRYYDYRILDTFCSGAVSDTGRVRYLTYNNQLVFEKQRNWVRTPNFRQLKAQKKSLPDNAYWYQAKSIDDVELEFRRITDNVCTHPSVVKRKVIFDYIPSVTAETIDEGVRRLTEDAVRAKLIAKAKDSEWSLPVFLGEGRETVRMIANTARTIASAYRDLRRGNLLGAWGSLGISGTASQRRRYYRDYGLDPSRAAANHWLAITYGWTPLLNDVHNAATTLAENALREEKTEMRVTASSRRQDREILQNVSSLTADKIRSTKESCRGVWRFKPTSLDSWGSFGLLNPLSVAWELVPFSFVVDWFLPIGRYLEGLDVPMRFDHLGGTFGYRREVLCELKNWKLLGTPGGVPVNTRFVRVDRTLMSGPPSLDLSSIVLDPKLGAARVTSAIALMSQVFRR